MCYNLIGVDIMSFDDRVSKVEELLENDIHLFTYQGLSFKQKKGQYLKADKIVF